MSNFKESYEESIHGEKAALLGEEHIPTGETASRSGGSGSSDGEVQER